MACSVPIKLEEIKHNSMTEAVDPRSTSNCWALASPIMFSNLEDKLPVFVVAQQSLWKRK